MTAGRRIRSGSQDWGTPLLYVDAVREMLGTIELDPCSNRHSLVDAAVEYMPPTDGLGESWDYATIYVNPPYGRYGRYGGRISDWLAKCAAAHADHGAEVIALVPVATNTSHWKTSVFGRAAAVCFLYDTRLKFLVNGKEGGKGAPMSCAMVYWGRRPKRFFDVFIEYGAVADLSRLKGVEMGKREEAKGQVRRPAKLGGREQKERGGPQAGRRQPKNSAARQAPRGRSAARNRS